MVFSPQNNKNEDEELNPQLAENEIVLFNLILISTSFTSPKPIWRLYMKQKKGNAKSSFFSNDVSLLALYAMNPVDLLCL